MIKQPKSVLITGGTGSFGKTMLKGMLKAGVPEIRILSRDEAKQEALRTELRDKRIKFYIGDIRDRDSVDGAMGGITHVFHAAALKQVPSCEFFPIQAVKTNIIGSENVIRSAIAHNVEGVVCLSTDKAVFPINAMGMTKAVMEKTAQAAARELGTRAKTTISCVRYGNVMYSRGSVIPLFVNQIKSNTTITVTEPSMTRFLMPLSDSVALVKYALQNANQGDLFIKKAAAATIENLVLALKSLFGVPDHPVSVIGWRHAEKLYETLASAQELSNADDLGEYFRILLDERDLNYNSFVSEGDTTTAELEDYHSHNTELLDVEGVKKLLLQLPEIQQELSDWNA